MAFPVGWPPRVASSYRSIRFFLAGTGTANFSDNAYLFSDQAAANTYVPLPYVAPGQNTPVQLGPPPLGGGMNANDSDPTASPQTMIWSNSIRIMNDGATDLEFSFDGTNVHGVVKPAEVMLYPYRHEAGISIRGAGVDFRIEAW